MESDKRMSSKTKELSMIPQEWEIGEVENYLDKIIDYRGKTPKKSSSGIETLSANSVKNGRIDYSQTYFISEKTFGEWEKRGKPQKGDVLLTTEGPLGEVAQLDRPRVALAQRLIVLRGKENTLDNAYLKYFLMSPIGQHELLARATGTTVQGIKQSEFRKIIIVKPLFPEQLAIARILSNLDARIESSLKMNRLLGTIGQAFFKRWFVDFEFPNEKGKPYKSSGGEMVESERGEIPKSWKIKKLGDFGKIVCGKTPPKANKDFFGGDLPFIKIPDMHSQLFIIETEDTLTDEGERFQSNKTVPADSICVSCIATVGLVSITTRESQTNQQINCVIPYEEFYRYYLFFTMKSMKRELEELGSGGSATLNVNTNTFSNTQIIDPEKESVKKFHRMTESLLLKLRANLIENHALSQIRDCLLPKLMSGKIRVPVPKENAEVQ